MSSNVSEMRSPRVAALVDLKRSGLTERDFKTMRLRALTQEETEQATGRFRLRSLLLPYFDQHGKETNFFRLRFLDEPRAVNRHKPQRYYQPPDTPPRAYLSPHVDWAKVFADPKQEVWITEGEKKAAKACASGVHCLGLGGVWSWKSTKQRQPVLPEFLQMKLEGRPIVLCFDSDAEEKPDVEGALAMLGGMLEQRGAQVYRVALPLLPDRDKTGLDDYLVEEGAAALASLPKERLGMSAELFRLNDELAVIDDPGGVLRIKTGELVSNVAKLKDVIYADRRVTTVDASGRLVETSAAAQWLKWPGRRRHRAIVYEPGQPAVTDDGSYNLWRGWGCDPKKGDTRPFDEYLDRVFEAKKAERRWLEQWLAYPLQHPGTKLFSCVLLWSTDTGTGKTMLGKTMRLVYGQNFGVVTEDRLHGQFSDWAYAKQFVVGEEISGADRRAEMNRLKHTITGDTISINRKFQAPFDIRNVVNFAFFSNHPDAFFLEDKDRRTFVHELTGGQDQKFFDSYVAWLERPASAPAVFARLMAVDLDGFNPHAPPPFTSAKADMVRLSGGEVDLLVRQLLESPDRYLRVGDSEVARDLYTLDEIHAMLDPDGKARLTRISVAKALRRQGLRELGSGGVTRTSKGPLRLWAVRNAARWLAAGHAELAAGYDGGEPKPARKPRF